MPPETQEVQSQQDSPQRRWPAMGRRSILRGLAGAGAAGIAAAGGAGAAVALTRPSAQAATGTTTVKKVTMAPMEPAAMAGPLVIYLRDTTTGVMDVFAGTGQMRMQDPALVAQLLRSMK